MKKLHLPKVCLVILIQGIFVQHLHSTLGKRNNEMSNASGKNYLSNIPFNMFTHTLIHTHGIIPTLKTFYTLRSTSKGIKSKVDKNLSQFVAAAIALDKDQIHKPHIQKLLLWAVENNKSCLVKKILEHDKINKRKNGSYLIDEQSIECALSSAIFKENKELLPLLLKSDRISDEMLRPKGYLHKCFSKVVHKKKATSVKILLASPKISSELVNTSAFFRKSNLLSALEVESSEIAKILLASQKCTDLSSTVHGQTALTYAIGKGLNEFVLDCLESEKYTPTLVNAKDKRGDTALICAVRNKNIAVVKALIASDKITSDMVNAIIDEGGRRRRVQEIGSTALMIAAERGSKEDFELVKILLSSDKTHPHVKNSFGQTALDLANQEGNTEIVSLLSAVCKQ